MTEMALSPDGRFAAYKEGLSKLNVCDFVSGQVKISIEKKAMYKVKLLAFAGPSRLLIGENSGPNLDCEIWDFEKKEKTRTFVMDGAATGLVAVSPGMRYAAAMEGDHLNVYELTTGRRSVNWRRLHCPAQSTA